MTGATDRIVVTYSFDAADASAADAIAREIAIEQSVEVPADIVPPGTPTDVILGRIEQVTGDAGKYRAEISYSVDSVGTSMNQLVNVHMGNISYVPGIKAVDLSFDRAFWQDFTGPKFGIAGIRRLAKKESGSLLGSVLKPHGLSTDELASLAYDMAIAGIDIIKDDHALSSDQPMAPFRDRCEKISDAVNRANRETGRSSLYFSNVSGHYREAYANAVFAKEVGAGGVMVLPGVHGFGLTHEISRDPDLDLPILSHSAMLGPMVMPATTGFAKHLVFAVFQRLAGADISVFTHAGARLGLSVQECIDVSRACLDPDGYGKPIFPCPGGGVGAEHAAALVELYGEDAIYLMGGSLLRHRKDMTAGVAAMRKSLADAAAALGR